MQCKFKKDCKYNFKWLNLYRLQVHCTLYTVNIISSDPTFIDCRYTVHCTLYTVHCTLYTVNIISSDPTFIDCRHMKQWKLVWSKMKRDIHEYISFAIATMIIFQAKKMTISSTYYLANYPLPFSDWGRSIWPHCRFFRVVAA